MKPYLLPLVVGVFLGGCGSDGSGPSGLRLTVSAPFTTVQAGQTVQLSATATDASGSVIPGAAVKWATSAQAVATVDATGLVSALSAGAVTVMATSGSATGSLALTVTPVAAGAATVSMPGFSFAPFRTTIRVGQTVLYSFPAEPHNVIFAKTTGAPADIPTSSNRTVARTFAVAGTFPFECTLHPGMSGVVAVER